MHLIMYAYACKPNHGSEPEVGWRWLLKNCNNYKNVTLVTRQIYKNEIENEIEKLQIKNLQLEYYDIPKWIGKWEKTSIGEQLCAYLWDFFLFFYLRKKFHKNHFDISQRVTFVSYRFPTLIWYFSKKFIFGPISGGERFPLNFLKIFSLKGKLKEIARLIIRNIALIDPFVLLTLYKADKIIAVTNDTKTILPDRYKSKIEIRPAISIDINDFTINNLNLKREGNKLKLLYIGRLLEWKGLMITLKALKEIPKDKYEFNIIGSGKDKHIFEKYINKHDLNVMFLGQKSRKELSKYYYSHDLFIFPSLHDSGGMVVLEAKAHNLPVLVGTFGGPQQFIDDRDILIRSKNVTEFISEVKTKLEELINEKN